MLNLTTYSILLSPKYRIFRYVLLCTSLFLFAYSEVIYRYSGIAMLPFILLTLNAFLCKFVLSVILIVTLIPCLLRQRYTLFWVSFLLLIFLFVWLQKVFFEDAICSHFNLVSWKAIMHPVYILLDILSQNVLWFMVLLGVLMGRILKYWNREYEYKQQLQASGLQMEAESMKEQISSSLLCSTLRKSGESAEVMPKETSATLMQLSRILRYQLYDCHQEKVWLESEIKFLREYLSILRYNGGCADSKLSVSGRTMGIFIPPLLFIPFLSSGPDSRNFIEISIRICDDLLTFELTDNHTQRSDVNIRKRLEQIYPQKHNLVIQSKHVLLQIRIR